MIRRILVCLAAIAALLIGGPAVADAAPLKPLRLADYTVSVWAPVAPTTRCDYNWIDCGAVQITATFAGLTQASWLPPGDPAWREGDLSGTVQVSRDYGCQNPAGKRLRAYDRTVTETAFLDTRRGMGFSFPRDVDTVTATTYAFLIDRQPGNCPAGTTAMTYRIQARNIQLQLSSYINGVAASGTYWAPKRGEWIGAVPTPTPVVATP